MTNKKILLPLAEGFEEIEAITIIDVLRRSEVEVHTVSLEAGLVKGAHGIEIKSDGVLDHIQIDLYHAIVLPGGMPGATNLLASDTLLQLILKFHSEGKICAAICAAPWVLHEAGILENIQATSYPSFKDKLTSAQYVESSVVVSGSIVTSRGVGTALEFSLKLVELLVGVDCAKQVASALLVGK